MKQEKINYLQVLDGTEGKQQEYTITTASTFGSTLEEAVRDASPLKDSGSRQEFNSGAVRDNGGGKGRFDLLSTQMLFRLAKHYENGAKKYADRNWEKGMPVSRCVDAAMRHLNKYLAGWMDEDHLAAVIWNISAIMYYEHKMPELMDLPEKSEEEIQKYCVFKED